MASTIITTNSNALSRAADAILARGDTPLQKCDPQCIGRRHRRTWP